MNYDAFASLAQSFQEYAICRLDTQGTITFANTGLEGVYGYTADEVTGKPFSLFYCQPDVVNGKPAEETAAALRAGTYRAEGWQLRKDGRRFWATITLTPIYQEGDQPVGFLSITRDLTRRQQAEAALVLSEERYRLMVEAVKDYAIFMLTPEGNIASWNEGAKRLKGYLADEAVGQHFSLFYSPDDLATNKPQRVLDIAKATGKYEEEGWRVRKDGSLFWASVVITAVVTQDNHLLGFTKVTRDLTERREAEQNLKESEARYKASADALSGVNTELKQANHELEQFTYIASHDLQEPLRKIQAFGDILKDQYGALLGEGVDYLERMQSAAGRMTTLIRDLLTYSRIGNQQQTSKAVDLDAVMQSVLVDLELVIAETGAKVQIGALPIVFGDPGQLGQLFTNLLSNALKFRRAGVPPHIEVIATLVNALDLPAGVVPTKTAPVYHLLEVIDNGIGFDEQYVDRIFHAFQRLHGRQQYAGTGIGLAICQKVVAQHGGAITARSRVGQGATFLVYLPAML